jgi:hypothetical protein
MLEEVEIDERVHSWLKCRKPKVLDQIIASGIYAKFFYFREVEGRKMRGDLLQFCVENGLFKIANHLALKSSESVYSINEDGETALMIALGRLNLNDKSYNEKSAIFNQELHMWQDLLKSLTPSQRVCDIVNINSGKTALHCKL